MTDIMKLSCPSCGSKLIFADNTNQLLCESCGNSYLLNQTGNSIALVPISKSDLSVAGNKNVVVRISNVLPSTYNTADRSQDSDRQAIVLESGDCPICGRLVSRADSFRCKNCQRTHICLTHQDKTTFFCSDCINAKNLSGTQKISLSGLIPMVTGSIALLSAVAANVIYLSLDDYNDLSTPFGMISILLILLSLVGGTIVIFTNQKRFGITALVLSIISVLVLLIVISQGALF